MENDLVAWGRVARIVTRGRVTGHSAQATVGFVEQADGSLLVAASSPRADWALNLIAEPRCRIAIADVSRVVVARPLEGAAYAAAIRELILKYGTPAEGLGAGLAFELTPER